MHGEDNISRSSCAPWQHESQQGQEHWRAHDCVRGTRVRVSGAGRTCGSRGRSPPNRRGRWYWRFVICPGAAGARQVLGVPPSNTWLPRTSCLPRPFAGVNPEVVAIDRLTRVVAVMRYGGALKDGARNCIWTGRFHVAPGQLAPVVLLGARIVVARARGVPRCSWHLIPRLARSPINLDSGQVLVLSFVARGEIGVDIRLENLAVVFASAIAIFVVTVDASTVGATFGLQCLWEGRRRPLVGVAVGCSARLVAEMGGGRAFENVAGLSRATS